MKTFTYLLLALSVCTNVQANDKYQFINKIRSLFGKPLLVERYYFNSYSQKNFRVGRVNTLSTGHKVFIPQSERTRFLGKCIRVRVSKYEDGSSSLRYANRCISK